MTKAITSGNREQSAFPLDPRTKILLLMCTNIVIIGGGFSGVSGIIRSLFASFPLLLLLLEKRWRASILYALFIGTAMGCEIFLLHRTDGALNLVIAIFSGVFSRFVPGLVMGFYVVSTTKISELIATMERMRFPTALMIPFAVMMRFFPTVKEESAAIGDAMKMRGIRMGGGNVMAMLEYRVVPLLISTVKIGEELSAAALTRGLGSPVKRTNICEVGFRLRDFILCSIAIVAFIVWIMGGIS